MNNKYYLATVLLVLGAFSPLYGVQNTPPPPPPPPALSCQGYDCSMIGDEKWCGCEVL